LSRYSPGVIPSIVGTGAADEDVSEHPVTARADRLPRMITKSSGIFMIRVMSSSPQAPSGEPRGSHPPDGHPDGCRRPISVSQGPVLDENGDRGRSTAVGACAASRAAGGVIQLAGEKHVDKALTAALAVGSFSNQ
jgi:hypothetical protein